MVEERWTAAGGQLHLTGAMLPNIAMCHLFHTRQTTGQAGPRVTGKIMDIMEIKQATEQAGNGML